jgi:hypothetical protein
MFRSDEFPEITPKSAEKKKISAKIRPILLVFDFFFRTNHLNCLKCFFLPKSVENILKTETWEIGRISAESFG